MLDSLPAELILLSCQYLNFHDVEQLAWVNRRIMQLIKRNVPIALEPELHIESLSISPSSKNEIVLDFNIIWASQPVQNSLFKEIITMKNRRKQASPDYSRNALFKFREHFRRNIRNSTHNINEVDSFTERETDLLSQDFMNLHAILAKTYIYKCVIDKCNFQMLWPLLKELSTVRAAFGNKEIILGHSFSNRSNLDLMLNIEVDRLHFASEPFLKEGVSCLRLVSPPFLQCLLNMPHFRDTRWSLRSLGAFQFLELTKSKAKNIHVEGGSMDLFGFIKQLLTDSPMLDMWKFEGIHYDIRPITWNDFDTIEGIMNSIDGLSYTALLGTRDRRIYHIRTSHHHKWKLIVTLVKIEKFYSDNNFSLYSNHSHKFDLIIKNIEH